MVKVAKDKGKKWECDSCHKNEEDWKLTDDGEKLFKELLALQANRPALVDRRRGDLGLQPFQQRLHFGGGRFAPGRVAHGARAAEAVPVPDVQAGEARRSRFAQG